MTTYKSKPALILVLPLAIILGIFAVISIYNRLWFGVFVIALLLGFITHTFLTTFYQVDGNKLRIKSGMLFNKTIPIGSIREISETGNPMSSSGASRHRLELKYNNSDSIIVSPSDKMGFIKELQGLNSAIVFHQ